MTWTDSEHVHSAELIGQFRINDAHVEIERINNGKAYRFTMGNLFGSQSAWFTDLTSCLRATITISQSRAPTDLRVLPGFIRYETRGRT